MFNTWKYSSFLNTRKITKSVTLTYLLSILNRINTFQYEIRLIKKNMHQSTKILICAYHFRYSFLQKQCRNQESFMQNDVFGTQGIQRERVPGTHGFQK